MVEVAHFQRRPCTTHHSLEGVFNFVRAAMAPDIDIRPFTLPFESRGLLRRIVSGVAARSHQRQVNHILGDVTYLAAFLNPSRTVTTFPDCVNLWRLPPGPRRALFKFFWYTIPIRRSRQITCISPEAQCDLVRYGLVAADDPRVIVIPCPADPNLSADSGSARLRNSKSRVLIVGTSRHKNVPRTLEALARLGHPILVDVVGPAGDLPRLASLLGLECSFHGTVTRTALQSLYASADLLAFLSLYEGFGLPILEAQAVGVPVVTSDLEPHRWVAGGAAEHANPADTADITRAVRVVLSSADRSNSLRLAGLENIKRFSVGRIADQYATLYRELARTP